MIEDYLAERMLLRRSLNFWRILAFFTLVIVISIGAAWYFGGEGNRKGPFIARISISGLITGDQQTLNLLKSIEESSASAVLVRIESPGGTTSGSELLYNALRHLSAKKPTAAVVGNLAASGAYVAAIGTDHIVALGNSLVGSIGVLIEYPNFAKLLDTLGVKVEEVKSSPLKAAPNGLEPTSPEARAALAALVDDSFNWFKSLVKERRSLDDQQLAMIDDGRVFTGRQGLKLGLVDELGGDEGAIAWFVEKKGIQKGIPVKDWKRSGSLGRLNIFSLAYSLARLLGLSDNGELLGQADVIGSPAALQGLVSVWEGKVIN